MLFGRWRIFACSAHKSTSSKAWAGASRIVGAVGECVWGWMMSSLEASKRKCATASLNTPARKICMDGLASASGGLGSRGLYALVRWCLGLGLKMVDGRVACSSRSEGRLLACLCVQTTFWP
jgi:hypothetical protein